MRLVLNLSREQAHELSLAIIAGQRSVINGADSPRLLHAVIEFQRAYVAAMQKGERNA